MCCNFWRGSVVLLLWLEYFFNFFLVIVSYSMLGQTSIEAGAVNSTYHKGFLNLFNSFSVPIDYVPQSIAIVANQLPMASGAATNMNDGFYGSFMFAQMVPKKVFLYDSVNLTLSGFSLRFLREIY